MADPETRRPQRASEGQAPEVNRLWPWPIDRDEVLLIAVSAFAAGLVLGVTVAVSTAG